MCMTFVDHLDIVESQLNIDDFERVIDPNTGQEVLQLKKGAAARKGLTDLLDVQFEMVIGTDGKQTIVIKGGGSQGNSGRYLVVFLIFISLNM